MALFSRRKNDSTQDGDTDLTVESVDSVEEATTADTTAPAEDVPQVNVSMSSFGGLGAPSAPRPQTVRPVMPEDIVLPLAPSDPPTNVGTIEGLRDNAVLRDALAALPPAPTGAQLLGVARQLLQGHIYLRVKGDAREQLAAGKPLQLGIVGDADKRFMLAYSSGRAIRDAFQADNDTDTSAFAQPSYGVIQNLINGDLDGLILDNHSKPARAVIPKDVLVRAMEQAESEFTLKTAMSQPRDKETKHRIIDAIPGARMWVAVGVANEVNGEKQYGIAEAHTQDGQRLLQLFSHPLEVVALQRTEQPIEFSFDKIKTAMSENEALAGVIIDPAGPSIRLTRAELEPILSAE